MSIYDKVGDDQSLFGCVCVCVPAGMKVCELKGTYLRPHSFGHVKALTLLLDSHLMVEPERAVLQSKQASGSAIGVAVGTK